MNQSDKTEDGTQDESVLAIFDAQNFEVPAELDARILAAAKSEGDQLQASCRVPMVPAQWAKPLLAIAAALIIGVGIVPRVLQSPEATVDSASDHSAFEEIPVSIAADGLESSQPNLSTRESSALRSMQSNDQAEISESADLSQGPFRQSNEAQMPPALTRKKNNALTVENFSAATATAAEDARPHQRSAADWLTYIESMIDRGEKETAREELKRLRENFPDFKVPDLFSDD
jgi:hypothetical protein